MCHVFPFTSSALCYRYRFTTFHTKKNYSMMSAVSQAPGGGFSPSERKRRTLSNSETPSRLRVYSSLVPPPFSISTSCLCSVANSIILLYQYTCMPLAGLRSLRGSCPVFLPSSSVLNIIQNLRLYMQMCPLNCIISYHVRT